MKKEPSTKDIAKALGHLGGKATNDKYGKDYFKRISKLGVEARKAKAKQKAK